jgi:hypothetical protein
MSAGEVISQIAAEATLAVEQRDREAAAFVDFVLRHTWPERAARHGAATVYSLIENHPFAKAHARQNDKG